MAGLMLSRHHSLFLESLPAGCTRGYASCVHRESSVSPQHGLPRAAVLLNTHFHVLRFLLLVLHTPLPRAARVGRCLQCSTSLVVVLQNDFMSLVFTNTAPTQHLSSCSSHVRSSSTMFVHVGSHLILLNPNCVTLLNTSFFLQCHSVVVYHWHLQHTTSQYCATA